MAIYLQHEDKDGHDWNDQTALFRFDKYLTHETNLKNSHKKSELFDTTNPEKQQV